MSAAMPKRRGFDESDVLISDVATYSAYEPHRRAPWKPQCTAVAVAIFNVLFILAGGAALVFALLFDGFLLTLWPQLFALLIALFALLAVAGITGVLGQCAHYHAAALAMFTACVLGQAACASVALSVVVNEPSSVRDVENAWRTSIADGGSAQQHVCQVSELFHCSGWDTTCNVPPANSEEDDVVAMLRNARMHWFRADALPGGGDAGNETITPSPIGSSMCPVCIDPHSSNLTCRDAIRRAIRDAQPGVIAAHAAFTALSVTAIAVAWLARRFNSSSQASRSYESPSRYL